MKLPEFVDLLAGGGKARRPSWPEGAYLAAVSAETPKPVVPGTVHYVDGETSILWSDKPDYATEFFPTDLEPVP
jgi:hypothetical protein